MFLLILCEYRFFFLSMIDILVSETALNLKQMTSSNFNTCTCLCSACFQMYVCEDCGHTTSDPELHFKHLQQNHPFCPALARCHDKRQFKFKSEKSETASYTVKSEYETVDSKDIHSYISMEESGEIISSDVDTEDDQAETRAAVAAIMSCDTSDPAPKPVKAITDKPDQKYSFETQYNLNLAYPTDRLTNKRPGNDPSATSPQKKLRTVYSPRKLKQQTTPTKVRPQPVLTSENGSAVIPKFDSENLSNKKFSDQPVKKRPLGSLTQNTIYQLNAKNSQSKQQGAIGTEKPYGSKLPLNSIIENNQW